MDVFQGLEPHGFALLDSKRSLDELGLGSLTARLPAAHARVFDASGVAERHLGKPLPNVALLGGLAALTGAVGIDALLRAIDERFRGAARDGNASAARAAFDLVTAGAPC